MGDMRALFQRLPEVVIITDAYGYILDNNRRLSDMELKRGSQIKNLIPGVLSEDEGECVIGSSIYKKQVTPIKRNGNKVGYTILLEDITEARKLFKQRQEVSTRLNELVVENIKANDELREYARQVKELSDYEEQLQLARHIHDDAGHAITAIHTISQMCLTLMGKDPKEYENLINEGLDICHKADSDSTRKGYDSVRGIIEVIKKECRFPIEAVVEGQEPGFAANLYETIDRICREAYHNTIDHSMADRLFINVKMSPAFLLLQIEDNGSFRGEFEKGFGLSTMEDIVHKSGGEVTFLAETGKGFGIRVKWGECDEGYY